MTATDRHHEHREPVDGCWRCWRRRHELLNGGSDGCRCARCRSREAEYKPRVGSDARGAQGPQKRQLNTDEIPHPSAGNLTNRLDEPRTGVQMSERLRQARESA